MIDKRAKFGKLISDIRKYKGFSQEDVEWDTGISTKTISRLENGNFKEASISSLTELSTLYEEDILALYIKTCFESTFVYNDILNNLDMSVKFMDQYRIISLYKKIEFLEKDKTFRSKDRDLMMLRLFLDKIYYKNMNSEEYRNRFIEIENNRLNKSNVLKYKYTDLEIRILLVIMNYYKSYLGVDKITILNNLLEKTRDRYINIFVSNTLINEYIANGKFEDALILIQGKIKFAISNKYYDCLAFLYYDKFICEYRLNLDNFTQSLNKSLFLAKMTDSKLSDTVTKKIKTISI